MKKIKCSEKKKGCKVTASCCFKVKDKAHCPYNK